MRKKYGFLTVPGDHPLFCGTIVLGTGTMALFHFHLLRSCRMDLQFHPILGRQRGQQEKKDARLKAGVLIYLLQAKPR